MALEMTGADVHDATWVGPGRLCSGAQVPLEIALRSCPHCFYAAFKEVCPGWVMRSGRLMNHVKGKVTQLMEHFCSEQWSMWQRCQKTTDTGSALESQQSNSTGAELLRSWEIQGQAAILVSETDSMCSLHHDLLGRGQFIEEVTKLSGAVDTVEGKDAVQKDLKRLNSGLGWT